jgi:phospholipid/cholesterol/gamma-HCH transport system substrate-binding protein
MKRAIKTHATDVTAIVGLLVLAIVVSVYVLKHEGLRFPIFSSSPFTDYVALQTGQAVTPGQGQSVKVSGVQIGTIGGISLQDGTAVAKIEIEPNYRGLIHDDATALLRPRTGLDDMFLELNPGTSPSPVAPEGFTIQMSDSVPDIDLDEVLSELDSDTRGYLDQLINGAGLGLKNRGDELAQVFERFEPTHRDLARLNGAIATRGADLQHLVHELAVLNVALAAKQTQISQMVKASAVVFNDFADEDGAVTQAVAELPGTLRQTTQTLGLVRQFADQLGPAAVNLLPAARALPAANTSLTSLAIPSAPIIKNQIRPFVVASIPVLHKLEPAAEELAKATPNLSTVFTVLNHFLNMLGYYPTSGGGQHGYLWWLAWVDHNARTLFDSQDGNGDFRNLFLQLSCASAAQVAGGVNGGLEEVLLNLTPILTDAGLCPAQAKEDEADYDKYEDHKLGVGKALDSLATNGLKVGFLPNLSNAK